MLSTRLRNGLFASCDRKGIQYCVLRGHDPVDTRVSDCEIDLLVDRRHYAAFRDLLVQHGFAADPAWGHAPHSFFSAVDPESGRRLILDVVTDLRYGRPIRVVRGGSASGCLARRRRTEFGFSLAPQDEFQHLLLHCALDKGDISERHRDRLRSLAAQLGSAPDIGEWFLQNQRPIFWRLFAVSPLRHSWYWLSGFGARRLAPLGHAAGGRGLVVALLGPDGAGKSTVARALTESHRRARRVYMGYGRDTGAHRRAIVEWLVSQARMPERRAAGIAGAVSGASRFVARCLLQGGRGLWVRTHRWLGRLVVLDRYVGEADERGDNVAARLRRQIISALSPRPDLLVVLDAPAEVLHERRPEHSIEDLSAKRAAYRRLCSSHPHSLVIDASGSVERIRNEVAARLRELGRHDSYQRTA